MRKSEAPFEDYEQTEMIYYAHRNELRLPLETKRSAALETLRQGGMELVSDMSDNGV